jgi:para-aminobenzoate synthetase
VRTLLIDNYDSFTWNLAHYIAEANGEEPLVVRNDSFSWTELMKMGRFDTIVLSPGPGTVQRSTDFGVSRAAIECSQVPLLGVCLGHQGIAHVHGAEVVHAPEPMHGRISWVHHEGDPLFTGIPSPWQVVCYHSLTVAAPLPAALVNIAWTQTGLLMGLRHRTRALWGVQFHPESILTEHGHRVLRNFRDIAARQRRRSWVAVPQQAADAPRRAYRLAARELTTQLTAEDLFVGLFGTAEHAFWLDSALAGGGQARFSYVGAAGTQGVLSFACSPDKATRSQQGQAFLKDLEARLTHSITLEAELPFQFQGGWVGYFGYEMKALFGAELVHRCDYPDALWLHVDRFIAVDQLNARVWAVCVFEAGSPQETQQRAWLLDMAERVAQLAPTPLLEVGPRSEAIASGAEIVLQLDQSHAEYLESIAACKRAIREGETYQVCLTNKISYDGPVVGLDLYRELRASNPAPFAAYLRSGELEIISASPERFLHIDRHGRIETKPIKGTCRRDGDPQVDQSLARQLERSEKNRAENLMIVDLLRNDLSRIAETSSVAVPSLMQIETYATVHQLVSTVSAQLRPGCSLLDVIAATFPGGSITGAPKLRTMQIIDQLERSARGVYCGSIGYLGYGRILELNIAIRTMALYRGTLSFGVGGGVTHLSDAEDEFAEIMLKALALIRALCRYQGGPASAAYRLVRNPAAPGRAVPLQDTEPQALGETVCAVF